MKLNENQQYAVDCKDKQILCLAAAGSGKTSVLVARIKRLIDDGVNPKSILVLTFTNAAAIEMQERFSRNNKESELPMFYTFHGFCYYLLAKCPEVRNALGYVDLPDIITDVEYKAVFGKTKIQSGVKLSDSKLMNKKFSTKDEVFQGQVFEKMLRKNLIKSNAITFDILCYGVAELFVKDSYCVKPLKAAISNVLVDEFQDTDPRQWDFVKSIDSADKFLVADALQAIYSFRGADSSICKSLANSEGWTVVTLPQNYRSTKPICDFANDMSEQYVGTYYDNTFRIELKTDKPGVPVYVRDDGLSNQREVVDNEHIEEIRNIIPALDGVTAILCRTNAEVDYISERISPSDTKYYTKEQIDNILHSALDEDFAVKYIISLTDKINQTKLLQRMYFGDIIDIRWIRDNVVAENPVLREIYSLICSARKIVVECEFPLEKCINLANLFIPGNISDICPKEVDDESICNCVSEYVVNRRKASLKVCTIHASKGLEYDNVILVGVNGNYFKLDREENVNLYYVGITRAKNILRVYKNDG